MKNRRQKTLLILVAILISIIALLPIAAKNISLLATRQLPSEDSIQKPTLPDGFPYITNFSAERTRSFATSSISQDDDNLMLFLNRRGLIVFNGAEEHFNELEKPIHHLEKNPYGNKIYALGNNHFGLLKKTSYYNYEYQSIKPSDEITDYFSQLLFSVGSVWFIGNHSIYTASEKESREAELYYQNDSLRISGAFFLQGNLYINIEGKGLFNLKQHGSGRFVTNNEILNNAKINFSVPYGEKQILGTNDNRLLVFDGTSIEAYTSETDDYFKESIISSGINIDHRRFAVGTINGGAIILEKDGGKQLALINFRTGLPDDEIFALFFDAENGLWLSHEFGVSRIMPDLPVRYYDNYPGHEGKIYDLEVSDSTLYLATGQGVFYLSGIKDYKEIERLVTERVRETVADPTRISRDETAHETDTKTDPKEEVIDEESEEEVGGLKKLWRRIRGSDDKEEDKTGTNDTETSESEYTGETTETTDLSESSDKPAERRSSPPKQSVSYKTVESSQMVYELQSITHQYIKTDIISGKCTELVPFGNGLLTASSNGLFYIENTQVKEVIKDEYVYNIAETTDPNISIVLTSENLYQITYESASVNPKIISYDLPDFEPYSVARNKTGEIILGGINHIAVLIPENNEFRTEEYRLASDYPENVILKSIADTLYIFSSGNVFKWEDQEIVPAAKMTEFTQNKCQIFFTKKTAIKICPNGTTQEFNDGEKFSKNQLQMLYSEENISYVYADRENNLWAVSSFDRIIKINKQASYEELPTPELRVTNFAADFLNEPKENRLQIREGFDSIAVMLSAPSYFNEEEILYTYTLDGVKQNLAANKNGTFFILNRLPQGEHQLVITARDRLNRNSNTLVYTIEVKPYFYNTIWFYSIVVILLAGGVWYVSNLVNARKRRIIEKHNEELEKEVQRRTEKIQQQNKELESSNQKIQQQNKELENQNQKIQQQNHEITQQNQEIFEQNREITDSIRYAERIQTAILPEDMVLKKHFSESFVLYKPRDIVGGDFYWVKCFDNKIFIATADCTGHGVPGGFVSMLGVSFLNEIVESPEISTGNILNDLRTKVISSLRQTEENKSRDGMDIALISIDFNTKILEFSGAHNPLILIRNNELFRVKGERMPVGYSRKKDEPFKTHRLDVLEEDRFYMFSDGFSDQFGGKHQRKFTTGRFRNTLFEIHSLSFDNQKKVLTDLFYKWKTETQQMDDLLIIGLKV